MNSLIRRLKSLKRLPGFHSLVLRQPLDDFEVATMILSAYAYRKLVGPMTLFADDAGTEWANSIGLYKLYDDVRLLCVDRRINQRIFWASGKIEAMSKMSAPCCSVDLDAVLWRRPPVTPDAVGLHFEPSWWDVYGWSHLRSKIDEWIDTPRRYRKHDYPPVNTGILCINDEDLRQVYCDTAQTMMIQESQKPVTDDSERVEVDGSQVTEMVVIEQLLLANLCSGLNKSLKTLAKLDLERQHVRPNHYGYHLWSSKRFYRKHERAKEVYLAWVLNKLWEMTGGQHDDVGDVVARAGLPYIRIKDGNVSAVRWSHRGEWTGPAEEVEAI